jgi:hypothetical protein
MANIKYSELSELTVPADGDLFAVDDVSEIVTEKTKYIKFSTLRKAALSDADLDTKITLDGVADEDTIRFYTGAGGQQFSISDGYLTPAVDNDLGFGTASKRISTLACINYNILGSFYAQFPTNGVSSSAIFMLGDSSTIAWFYVNAAPPGWKVYGVADAVLRTGATGGVDGGNWTISGGSVGWPANYSGDTPISGGNAGAGVRHNHELTWDAAWRPYGYIGKLYQLDLA